MSGLRSFPSEKPINDRFGKPIRCMALLCRQQATVRVMNMLLFRIDYYCDKHASLKQEG